MNESKQPRRLAKDLFASVLELSPSMRSAFLDRECAGDAALRDEVEDLLSVHRRAAGFMDAGGTAETEMLPALPSEQPGAMIGPYKLLQEIGSGGFGVVFMAEQTAPVRRRVALKLIRLGMDTKQVIARFEAERQALAIMDHPNIAKVFDAGATAEGRPYFVMELVAGDDVTSYCERNRLSVRERLDLFLQVCRAVQHAHTKGIIHRDLKPSNVLVTTHEGEACAKVIDFGIAKATSRALTDKSFFTAHMAVIGTPAYCSPEQISGSPDIDTRTDVYALGVLLYELLSGAMPFDLKELREKAWDEVCRTIKEDEPPAPSVRLSKIVADLQRLAAGRRTEPARLRALLRGELDWITLKCLEKSPNRRYESASALAADVERHLKGEAVVAAPPSVAYRVRKYVRRHKAAVGVVGALVAGMIGTGTGWIAAYCSNIELREAVNVGLDGLGKVLTADWKPGADQRTLQLGGDKNPDRLIATVTKANAHGNITVDARDADGKPASTVGIMKLLSIEALDARIDLQKQVQIAEDGFKAVFRERLGPPAGNTQVHFIEKDGVLYGIRVREDMETNQYVFEPAPAVNDLDSPPSPEFAENYPVGLMTYFSSWAVSNARDLTQRTQSLEIAQSELACQVEAAREILSTVVARGLYDTHKVVGRVLSEFVDNEGRPLGLIQSRVRTHDGMRSTPDDLEIVMCTADGREPTGGEMLLMLGQYAMDMDEELRRKQDELKEQLQQTRLAQADYIMAQREVDFFPEIARVEQAYQAREELLGPRDHSTVKALYALACSKSLSDDPSCLALFREAIDRKRSITANVDRELLEMLGFAANSHAWHLDFDEAAALSEEIARYLPEYYQRVVGGKDWLQEVWTNEHLVLTPIAMHGNIRCWPVIVHNGRPAARSAIQWRQDAAADLSLWAISGLTHRDWVWEHPRSTTESIELAQRAVLADPEWADGHRALALAHLRCEEYRDAAHELEQATTLATGSKRRRSPMDAAIESMIRWELGLHEEARLALDWACKELNGRIWSNDDPWSIDGSPDASNTRRLIIEAEAMIGERTAYPLSE
ncbi:MAG TPA: serine/threonine-protein kinase [Phycisphaerales bacterium]|nr:serine/threonine-protein kinase [Phycisphaerales bacterium]